MAISKSKREAVYRKYDGHCAYCGREIAYKDMQVDHFQPLRAWGIEDAGTDDLDNLMPACRMCNHYKRANSLETFRQYIDRDALRQAVLESQHDNPHPRGMAHIAHDCEHAHFVAMIARFGY